MCSQDWHRLITWFTSIIVIMYLGFPAGSAGKESACNVRDLGSIPGLGRSPGEGKGYPLQYSGLENFIDCKVHEVTKSWAQLSNFHVHVMSQILSNALSLRTALWKWHPYYLHFADEETEAFRCLDNFPLETESECDSTQFIYRLGIIRV